MGLLLRSTLGLLPLLADASCPMLDRVHMAFRFGTERLRKTAARPACEIVPAAWRRTGNVRCQAADRYQTGFIPAWRSRHRTTGRLRARQGGSKSPVCLEL